MTHTDPSLATAATDVFVARQAIFDRTLKVVGYELLFRDCEAADSAVFDDVDRASFQVILNTFMDLGLEQIVGQIPAFLNLSRGFFLSASSIPFPRDRVVLELLEGSRVDDALVESVRGYAHGGYRIALDDFLYAPEMDPLLELADIVKFDILQMTRPEIEAQIEQVRPFGVRLLAEKVETPEDFEYCRDLGFDFFQGYFLCRPKVVHGHRLPTNRLNTLKLLSRLQDPRAEIDELEKIIREDLSLSYKLLRLINSAFYGLSTKIDSIRQTLVLLGVQRIRAWVSLLTLSGLSEKPSELMVTAMVRARMAEVLGNASGRVEGEICFTAGLFSALDALLDLPMEQILESLPLTEELTEALLERTGPIGEVLACAIAYERGEWDAVRLGNLDAATIRDCYLEAVEWAGQAGSQIDL